MPYTFGFATPLRLREHFKYHRVALGVLTEKQYLEKADRFVGGPERAGVWECVKSGGDRVRFDRRTSEFGVLSRDNVVRTYHVRTRVPRNAEWFRRMCSGKGGR